MSKNLMVKKKAKKPKVIYKERKLIDILHEAFVNAGFDVERDGWIENGQSDPPNDPCEWLDVKSKMIDNKQQIVHFYFENNSTKLTQISLYLREVEIREKNVTRVVSFVSENE